MLNVSWTLVNFFVCFIDSCTFTHGRNDPIITAYRLSTRLPRAVTSCHVYTKMNNLHILKIVSMLAAVAAARLLHISNLPLLLFFFHFLLLPFLLLLVPNSLSIQPKLLLLLLQYACSWSQPIPKSPSPALIVRECARAPNEPDWKNVFWRWGISQKDWVRRIEKTKPKIETAKKKISFILAWNLYFFLFRQSRQQKLAGCWCRQDEWPRKFPLPTFQTSMTSQLSTVGKRRQRFNLRPEDQT